MLKQKTSYLKKTLLPFQLTIFRSILTQMYVFLVLFTIFHFDLLFFSKVHPAFHNIANGIKPGRDSKTTEKHAADCSKAVVWGVKCSM